MAANYVELREQLRAVEQRLEGCRKAACATHGKDVKRAKLLDKQLTAALAGDDA